MRFGLFLKKNVHIILPAVFAGIVLLGGIVVFARSRGDAVINEVCSSNVACCEDAAGNYPDWIEIYNPTDDNIDLSGYTVNRSTDLKKEKYVIPEGTILAPGSFYLFDPLFTIPAKGCVINLIDKDKQYVDRISVPKLEYDTTYAREADGSYSWKIQSPTPGYSNSDGEVLPPVVEGKVTASRPSGFYDGEFDLKLRSSSWGRRIYYTVDGTDPRTNGTEYHDPIHIYDRSDDENVYSMISEVSMDYEDNIVSLPSYPVDKCTVVRAVSCDRLGRFTDVDTFTYFVGYDEKSAYDQMPVVSVTGDPEDLFSHENGIMVLGEDYDRFAEAGEPDDYDGDKSNFTRRGRGSERRVSLDIFNEDHAAVVETSAGLRIKGLSSRWDVQKSFSVFFRQPYGGNYKESFTVDGVEFDVHSFALDKCGQDTATKMVDAIMDRCMSDTGCATKKGVPCCLFINGEYWGFYWLTERFDRSLLADRYKVEKDDVVYVDKEQFTSDSEWNEDNFDREGLLEYYAANIIVAHKGDWPEFNFRFWKTLTDEGTEYGDSKLRPVIFDMNSYSMNDPEYDAIAFMLGDFYPFIKLTGEDEDFRKDLVATIDRMSRKEFDRQKVLALIDELYERMKPQMILDKMRYSNCSSDEAEKSFDESVEGLRQFYRDRWDYLEKYKEEYLNGE